MPASGTYSVDAVRVLDTHRTPIQKQPEALLCLVGISRRYYLGDDVYPTFHCDDDREIDLFSLIRAPNPTKVKTGSRPRAPHELPLLTLTASRVIEMDEPAVVTDSSGVPSAIERSPLDFADEAEASDRETTAPEMPPPEEVPLTTAPGAGQAVEAVVAEPPARPRPADPLAFADAPSHPPADVAQSSQGIAVAEDPGSENASSPTEVGSPGSVYRPEWGVTNGSLLYTPEACQDLVDHAAPPGYFTELRHMPNDEFLRHYNVNLARQVAMGSQLRLRFKQEAKLLKKSVAQVARRDKRIQDRELEIKNLEALLKTVAEMKRAAEGKNAELMRELEDIRAQFSSLKAFADVVSAGVAKGMSEGLKHGVKHGRSQLELESIEAYDPEAEAKFVAALQSLKDLKFSLLDQLEGLKDAPMDVIMAALYLESDTGGMPHNTYAISAPAPYS
nr:putative transposase (putative), gypsy type [Tanacetum cinerariifolium]